MAQRNLQPTILFFLALGSFLCLFALWPEHTQKLFQMFGFIMALLLTLFSLRRMIYGLMLLVPPKQKPAIDPVKHQSSVLILIPCHNEVNVLSRLLHALYRQNYPAHLIQIVVIDDASTDETAEIVLNFKRSLEERNEPQNEHFFRLHLHRRTQQRGLRGKPAALNDALEHFKEGEILYLFDADHVPEAGCLTNALRHFHDSSCVAVSGMSKPLKIFENPLTFYQYIEGLVHQRATLYANARLGLNPMLLGSNFGIRRTFLEQIGGFREDVLLEDADLTLRISEKGGKITFSEQALSLHEVPRTIKAYLEQHTSWARGFHQMLRLHKRSLFKDAKMPLFRRIECIFFSLGYSDRLLFAGCALLFGVSVLTQITPPFPRLLWYLFLGAPAFEVIATLIQDKAQRRAFMWLPYLLLIFPLEIWMALHAFWDELWGQEIKGYKTARWKKEDAS